MTRPATGCAGTRTDTVLTLSADSERRTAWTCSAGSWVSKTEWTKYPHADVKRVGSGATADTPALALALRAFIARRAPPDLGAG